MHFLTSADWTKSLRPRSSVRIHPRGSSATSHCSVESRIHIDFMGLPVWPSQPSAATQSAISPSLLPPPTTLEQPFTMTSTIVPAVHSTPEDPTPVLSTINPTIVSAGSTPQYRTPVFERISGELPAAQGLCWDALAEGLGYVIWTENGGDSLVRITRMVNPSHQWLLDESTMDATAFGLKMRFADTHEAARSSWELPDAVLQLFPPSGMNAAALERSIQRNCATAKRRLESQSMRAGLNHRYRSLRLLRHLLLSRNLIRVFCAPQNAARHAR